MWKARRWCTNGVMWWTWKKVRIMSDVPMKRRMISFKCWRMEKLGWTSNIVHEIPMMSTTWFNFQEQNEEVHFFLKKNVHVNRMILCNRKPHPNCLNEFADEIKSTRRKQIFSLVNAYERKKIEFQVVYALFTGYFKLIRV